MMVVRVVQLTSLLLSVGSVLATAECVGTGSSAQSRCRQFRSDTTAALFGPQRSLASDYPESARFSCDSDDCYLTDGTDACTSWRESCNRNRSLPAPAPLIAPGWDSQVADAASSLESQAPLTASVSDIEHITDNGSAPANAHQSTGTESPVKHVGSLISTPAATSATPAVEAAPQQASRLALPIADHFTGQDDTQSLLQLGNDRVTTDAHRGLQPASSSSTPSTTPIPSTTRTPSPTPTSSLSRTPSPTPSTSFFPAYVQAYVGGSSSAWVTTSDWVIPGAQTSYAANVTVIGATFRGMSMDAGGAGFTFSRSVMLSSSVTGSGTSQVTTALYILAVWVNPYTKMVQIQATLSAYSPSTSRYTSVAIKGTRSAYVTGDYSQYDADVILAWQISHSMSLATCPTCYDYGLTGLLMRVYGTAAPAVSNTPSRFATASPVTATATRSPSTATATASHSRTISTTSTRRPSVTPSPSSVVNSAGTHAAPIPPLGIFGISAGAIIGACIFGCFFNWCCRTQCGGRAAFRFFFRHQQELKARQAAAAIGSAGQRTQNQSATRTTAIPGAPPQRDPLDAAVSGALVNIANVYSAVYENRPHALDSEALEQARSSAVAPRAAGLASDTGNPLSQGMLTARGAPTVGSHGTVPSQNMLQLLGMRDRSDEGAPGAPAVEDDGREYVFVNGIRRLASSVASENVGRRTRPIATAVLPPPAPPARAGGASTGLLSYARTDGLQQQAGRATYAAQPTAALQSARAAFNGGSMQYGGTGSAAAAAAGFGGGYNDGDDDAGDCDPEPDSDPLDEADIGTGSEPPGAATQNQSSNSSAAGRIFTTMPPSGVGYYTSYLQQPPGGQFPSSPPGIGAGAPVIGWQNWSMQQPQPGATPTSNSSALPPFSDLHASRVQSQSSQSSSPAPQPRSMFNSFAASSPSAVSTVVTHSARASASGASSAPQSGSRPTHELQQQHSHINVYSAGSSSGNDGSDEPSQVQPVTTAATAASSSAAGRSALPSASLTVAGSGSSMQPHRNVDDAVADDDDPF